MSDSWGVIVVAIISLAGTLGGSWMGVRQANKLVNWRIDQLEAKVMKHNNLIERTAVLERDLNTAFSQIDEVKNEINRS